MIIGIQMGATSGCAVFEGGGYFVCSKRRKIYKKEK